MIAQNTIHCGDCREIMPNIQSKSIHLILSDIPYGIGIDAWDVLHTNSNSSYMGKSPAQESSGKVFEKRGKPLNGWSQADKKIPIEYYKWCQTWVDDWLRVLKPGGSAFVFAGRQLAHRLICAFEDAGFTFKDMVAWTKPKAAHRAQRLSIVYDKRGDQASSDEWQGWKLGNLRPIFEPILWFTKPYKIGSTLADNVLQQGVGAYHENAFLKYAANPDNIINSEYLKKDSGLHPTQKPLKLMQALVELTTKEGQHVLDPFCGSGSSLVAAASLNRSYIGIEKNEQYYLAALKRLSQMG